MQPKCSSIHALLFCSGAMWTLLISREVFELFSVSRKDQSCSSDLLSATKVAS